jgi:uncharacterized C2H2 Zn-finger protein
MTEYKEVTRKEWKESLLIIGLLVVIISAGAFFLLPENWLAWVILVVIAVIVIIIIAAREGGNVVYKCPACGQEFEISAVKNVFAPHGVTKKEGKWLEWKQLECPICHGRSKMFPVKKERQQV